MDINTLTELLRKEKRSPYLQEISEDFYSELGTYVGEFHKKYPEHAKERRNLEKILVDLYNARERKVVLSALSFARFGKEPDIDNLAPEEERTLKQIMEILRLQRDKHMKFPPPMAVSKGNEKSVDEGKIEEQEKVEPELKAVEESTIIKKESQEIGVTKRTIRMLEDTPQIVGVDGKTYGSFKAEDVVTLPEANAKIFIKRGAAVPIQYKD